MAIECMNIIKEVNLVIKECTPDLETALSVLERGFFHFLALEGFITDDVSELVLDPQSMLSGKQRAGLW